MTALATTSMELPCLEEYLASCSVRERLGEKITNDEHLARISRSLSNWRVLRPYLGLSEAEADAISGNHPLDTEGQRSVLL